MVKGSAVILKGCFSGAHLEMKRSVRIFGSIFTSLALTEIMHCEHLYVYSWTRKTYATSAGQSYKQQILLA